MGYLLPHTAAFRPQHPRIHWVSGVLAAPGGWWRRLLGVVGGGEQAAVGVEMMPLLSAEARKRQVELAGTRKDSKDLGTNWTQGEERAPKAIEIAAKAVGVGARHGPLAFWVVRLLPTPCLDLLWWYQIIVVRIPKLACDETNF